MSGRVGGEEVAHVVGKSVTHKETENMSGCAEDDGRQASHYCRRKWQLRTGGRRLKATPWGWNEMRDVSVNLWYL